MAQERITKKKSTKYKKRYGGTLVSNNLIFVKCSEGVVLEQAVWRGMPYFDVFWRKRHLTQRELRAVYSNYYTYVFWALIISVLVLLDLHGFAERVSLMALVAYTTSLAIFTFVLYYYASVIGIKLSQRYRRFFLVFPVVGFVAVTIATYALELGMSAYFGSGMSFENAAQKLPVNFILTLVLETFFLTFVMPTAIKTSKKEAKRQQAGAKSACTTITIAGKTYYCKDLISISSQDHYVRIRTKDGEDLVRARLSDLIGNLSCQNGIQPHRSHWVPLGAVAGVVSSGGQKTLKLHDGSELPIARGRIGDVQEWLEKAG